MNTTFTAHEGVTIGWEVFINYKLVNWKNKINIWVLYITYMWYVNTKLPNFRYCMILVLVVLRVGFQVIVTWVLRIKRITERDIRRRWLFWFFNIRTKGYWCPIDTTIKLILLVFWCSTCISILAYLTPAHCIPRAMIKVSMTLLGLKHNSASNMWLITISVSYRLDSCSSAIKFHVN